jgi:hypothetical protein
VIPRIARGASLLAVLLAGWLLLASTPAAGGLGGSPADDPAADGVAVVGPATERLPGPTALPRLTPWAAFVAAIAAVVLTGTIQRLRPARAAVHSRLLVGSRRGRAPPAFTS